MSISKELRNFMRNLFNVSCLIFQTLLTTESFDINSSEMYFEKKNYLGEKKQKGIVVPF